MNTAKFTVSYGHTHKSLQLTFFYCSKVNGEELAEAIAEAFPGVPAKDLNYLPGYVSCTITTGKDLELPQI